jgi:hypothetical protein
MREFLTVEIEKRMSEIRQKEAERLSLGRHVEILGAEVRLLTEIAARLDEEQSSTRAVRPAAGAQKSRLSPRWMPVLRTAVACYPEPVKNEEVPAIQRAAGQDPADTNGVRSHVWTQSQAGLYEKLGPGTFRATQAGADAIGLPLGSSRGATSDDRPSQESETPNSDELSGAPKGNGAMPLNL